MGESFPVTQPEARAHACAASGPGPPGDYGGVRGSLALGPTDQLCPGPGVPESQDRNSEQCWPETALPGERRAVDAPWAAGTVGRAGGACHGQVPCMERRGSVQVGVWRGSGLQPSGWCPALGVGLRACPCDGVDSGGAPLVSPQGSPELPGGRGGPRSLRDPSGGAVLHPRGPAYSSGSRNPAALGWADLSRWQGRRRPSVRGPSTEGACLPALVPH